MKKRTSIAAIALMILVAGCTGDGNKQGALFKPIPVTYPQTFRDTLFADTLFNEPVPDPYRWMEAEEAPILQEWLETENEITREYLSGIVFRDAIAQRLRDLYNFERVSSFRKVGDYYYYFKNSGLQEQDIFCRQGLTDAKEEVVLDPNLLSREGAVALGQVAFSADGRYLAYEKAEGGNDWRTIHVFDQVEKRELPDTLRWVKYSQIAWAGKGFFYSRYPAPLRGDKTSSPMEFHQVFYHQVGTSQAADQLIFADRARSRRGFTPRTSEDERFLVLEIWETLSGNAIYVMDLNKPKREFVPIVDDMVNEFKFIGSHGDHLFFLTDFEAGKRKLIRVSIGKPDPGYWEEVIPEKPDLLFDVYMAGGKLVAHYLRDAQSLLQVYELDGTESSLLPLREPGTVSDFQGQADSDRAFFTFETFLAPPAVYELDFNLLTVRIFKPAKVNFNAGVYETRLVYCKSHDAVDIPIFITLKKGIKLDGNKPLLLSGNGSFGACTTPLFDPIALGVLENGGILAHAVLRGGGEYGREWHENGVRTKKRNTADDFLAAANYLISQGFTRKEKLAISGDGGGGTLAGMSITQRPDLFQAAVVSSGIFDLMRYQQFTIGGKWAYDFGRSEQEKEFDHLNGYSPLHNVLSAEYPAVLLIAGETDDRVYPAHSYKFAAELQAQQKGPLPILLNVREQWGGGNIPTSLKISEGADRLSFLFYQLQQPVVYELNN